MKKTLLLVSVFVGLHVHCSGMFISRRLAFQGSARASSPSMQKMYHHDVPKFNTSNFTLEKRLAHYKAKEIHGMCLVSQVFMTPNHAAIYHRDLECLELFLKASNGIRVVQEWIPYPINSSNLIDACDQCLRTPLILALTLHGFACNYSDDPITFLETKKMVELLIAHGADVNAYSENHFGFHHSYNVSKTPLRFFLQNFHSDNVACIKIAQEIVQLLRDAGAIISPLFNDEDLLRNPKILLLLSGSYVDVCTE
jgi:hypothetical protein